RGLAAGPGAMTRIGPVGYSWADAPRNAETTSGARSTQRRVGIMRLASMRSEKHVLSRLEDELEFSANPAYALVRDRTLHQFLTPSKDAAQRVDQLGGHTNPVRRPADAPFQHVADAKVLADLLDVRGLALVGERRVPSDYEERVKAR